MILNEVVIENFGVFGGRQEVVLTPKGKKRRIILVGGLNGRGKTTLLDAIQVALYGKRANCSNRGSLSYETYLNRARFRGADASDPFAVELAFSIQEAAHTTQYRVRRSWRQSGQSVKESLEVSRDGIFDRALTATWAEHIEELLPLEISSLFFFDGEKIESLADPDQASGVISAAVTALLGLGVIERLQRDLLVIEKRKQDDVLDVGDNERLKVLANAVEGAEESLARAKQKCAAERNGLDRIARALDEAEKLAQREGGDLFERRMELERSRASAQTDLARTNASLREMASDVLPLALCGDLVRSLAAERSAADDIDPKTLHALLADRDRSVVAQLESELDSTVLQILSSILSADRQQRLEGPGGGDTYSPSITSTRAATAALEQLTESLPLVGALIEDRLSSLELISDFDRQLAGVPGEEGISHILKERDQLRLKQAEAEGRLGVIAEEIADLERALEMAIAEHESARQQAALANMQGKDAGRILEHGLKVRTTLEQLKSEVRKRSIAKIESEVLSCYRKLLGKKVLVVGLSLDADTCTPLLTTRDGEQVHIERLSAGERQLFAVAMLWGLARVAGRTLPTIIDTPLGRLDSVHRSLLVDKYFPNAADQVILLSTDEEIDEGLAIRLEPATGRSYHMEFDEVRQTTEILPGYFYEEVENVA